MQEFDFLNGARIQRCENWYRTFTNPFASSSINFGFTLKLLRIKDQWYTVLVKCQFVCNRCYLQCRLTEPRVKGSVMALNKDGFLPAAFSKVKKIGKGLRSNGTSNTAGFLQRHQFTRLGKDWKDRAHASIYFLTFYSSKQTFTRWFSFSIFRHSIRFSSLRYTLWDWLQFICF